MKIRFYMDKDGNCFTTENIRNSCENLYWEDMCANFLDNYTAYDIVEQLFFEENTISSDDFTEYEWKYINKRLEEDYKEIILEIADEDIVE